MTNVLNNIVPIRPEGATLHSPGQRPGYKAFTNNAPCKGNSKIPLVFKAYKKRSSKSLDLEDPSKRRQPPTLPHCIAVPSAQAGLTSLFGMGRGGTPPQ